MTVDDLPAVASCDSDRILIGVFLATCLDLSAQPLRSLANALFVRRIICVHFHASLASYSQSVSVDWKEGGARQGNPKAEGVQAEGRRSEVGDPNTSA